jgi:uridine phosphorylase
MPTRLRPTAPIASEAILVGDPGRALMLAQEFLTEPKMSNHARGLWGYTGTTEAGKRLTIQATGMGGPSARVVLADLAELGVRRAVRVGTCASLGDLDLGDFLLVSEAHEFRGSFVRHGRTKEPPNVERPDAGLASALRAAFPAAQPGSAVSFDGLYRPQGLPTVLGDVADMQTAALFASAEELGVAVAALLIAVEKSGSAHLGDEEIEAAAKVAGRAAVGVL